MFQVVHYICEADELKRTDLCSHLASEPAVLFSKDDLTKVNFYVGIRCLSDIFNMSAPINGGLPRCPTQDQKL